MSKFCPVYPQPKKSKLARWKMFFSAQQSWLDGLYERSYQMHMGEVQLPGSKLYMVNQPDLVRKVLVDDVANYPKHSMLGKALEPLLGQSIFTTNGMLWKRQRSMMNPAFEQARMTVAFPRMREAALAMLERMAKASKHAPYDVDAEMTLVTADIIFRTIFTLPITSASAHKVFAAFAAYQNLTPKISLPTLYGLGWLVPFWTRRKSQRVAQEIREELAALIRPRFEAARQQADDSSSAGEDILGALLAAKDEHTGEGFEFEELLDQVAMLFLAGHETSASALSWALHL
ncbi:MAG: cytochrome P450, partial [Brachymonas sp.]|nr:cytochrome P450 [Brachymonas sp.]